MSSISNPANTNSSSTHSIDEAPEGLLPQYGFGKVYAFDALVAQHRFLFRVHTPKRKHGSVRSRATSPQPSLPPTRSTSPFASPSRRPILSQSYSHSRSPSASLAPSIVSTGSGSDRGREGSDYFGLFGSPRSESFDLDPRLGYGDEDEDEGAPGDPYFLSRRFKEDLTSTDVHTRRRTISTLSTLSGGSSYIGTEFGGAENRNDDGRPAGLARSASMLPALGGHGRTRKDSVTTKPGRRSHSIDVQLHSSSTTTTPEHPAQSSDESANIEAGSSMTYEDLVHHLDWTTRASSPYVTTSFSFFWCLWEAVRRYKLAVKQDVEIAVIDARSVIGRAKTALEILRGVEGGKQDKAYWKWYRFALESQDVLVFGAIPGDAIYASVPLTSILPRLPSYFFKPDPQVNLPAPDADPREPVPAAAVEESEDPRSPSSRSPTGTQSVVFFPPSTPGGKGLPGTPGKAFTPRSDLSSNFDLGGSEDGDERRKTAELLSRLSWDVGTTLKPRRKASISGATSPKQGAQAPRHTTHADFCRSLTRAFEGIEAGKTGEGRKEEDKLRDATTSAVKLAEVLIEPWFRARCAEAADPFHFDMSDDESSEEEEEELCLGLAGDGCSLEHKHGKATSHDEDTETEDPRMEAAETLSALSVDLARWPANWWFAERRQGIEGLIKDVVGMCVRECARGVGMRVWWGVQSEYESQRRRAVSEVGSPPSVISERKGRRRTGSLTMDVRGREERSRSPASDRRLSLARRASEGSPSPSGTRHYPSPVSMRDSPYKPRARSPLGSVPALGPAIVLKSGTKDGGASRENDADAEGDWSPTTPPPTPPLTQSLTLPYVNPSGNLQDDTASDTTSSSMSNKTKRTPPPPPPPRSAKRDREPTLRKPASFASLDSSIESIRASDSPNGNGPGVPGGWPDGDDDSTNKGDGILGSPFPLNASTGPQASRTPPLKPQRRPVSWSPGTSATIASAGAGAVAGSAFSHNRSASDGGSLAGSRKSSQESLHPYGSTSGNGRPTPSPRPGLSRSGSGNSSPSGSIRRSQKDKEKENGDSEAFLAEVVSSALSLGVTPSAIFNSGSSPLRLDTSSSSPSKRDGHERTHRRHVSVGETELSPVAELAGESEAEAEDAKSRQNPIFSLETAMKAVEDLNSTHEFPGETTHVLDEKMTFSEPESETEVEEDLRPEPTRYTRQRTRSSTLASIPEAEREEDFDEWTMIEIPKSMAASMKSTSSSSASIKEEEGTQEKEDVVKETILEDLVNPADIPLPPSPVLAPIELPGEVEPLEEIIAEDEPVISHERKLSVPEITLSAPVEGSAPNDVSKDTFPPPNHDAFNEAPATTETTQSSMAQQRRSHALNRTSVKRYGRALLRSLGLGFLLSTSRHLFSEVEARSPALDDADVSTSLTRWSPLFSILRSLNPFRHPGIHHNPPNPTLNSHRRSSSSSISASQLILGPRPAWDSPIFDEDDSMRAGAMDLDDAFEVYNHQARSGVGSGTTSWAMSCFVCGIMASLALASVQRQRELQMLVGNRYY